MCGGRLKVRKEVAYKCLHLHQIGFADSQFGDLVKRGSFVFATEEPRGKFVDEFSGCGAFFTG